MIKRIIVTGIGILIYFSTIAQFSEIKNTLLSEGANSILLTADIDKDGFSDVFIAGETLSDDFAAIYQNKGDSTFFDLGIGIPYLSDAAASFTDLNNDTYADLIYTGMDDSNNYRFYIYINQQNNTFIELSNSIPGIRYGVVRCQDMNHDGWQDIFISGYSETGNIASLYINNGDETFSQSGISFDALRNCGAVIADFDRNSYPDIVYSGLNASLNIETYYYQNLGDMQFVKKTNSLPRAQLGGVEACDVNNDGYTDIAVYGKDNSNNHIAKIYQNNSGLSFTLLDDLTGIRKGKLKLSDYNNDGYADAILSGIDGSDNYITELYLNNSGSGFTLETDTITALGYSAVLWIDFNNDHKNDILLGGTTLSDAKTLLLSSDLGSSNQKPSVISGLSSVASSDTVWLTWDKGTDTETASNGLTYDIYLHTDEDDDVDYKPAVDLVTGERYTFRPGAFSVDSLRFKNLTDGKYWWTVQSVDAAFRGSAFATADTFYISKPIHLGNDTIICFEDSISISLTDVAGTMEWYRSTNPSVAFSTEKEIKIEITEKDTIWAIVTKDYGDQITDTVIVDIYDLPDVNLGDDMAICYGSEVDITLGTETDIVNWSTLSGNYTDFDTNDFMHPFYDNDEIYAELTDINGCKNSDTLLLTVRSLPGIDLVNDTALCLNNTLNLNVGTVNDSVNWYSLTSSMEIINSNSFEYVVVETNTFQIELYDQYRCVNFDTIVVIARELPTVDAGENQLICEGYSTTIGPEVLLTGASYLWNPDSNIDDVNIANPSVSPTADTKYYLEITDQFGCQNNDSVEVQINPKGTFDVGVDQAICPGESAELGGNPTASGSIMEYAYEWSPTQNMNGSTTSNPVVSPTETTTYQLVIFTGTCPVDTLNTTVTINPLPTISIMNDTLAGFQEDITLWADGGVSYTWMPSENLDNPDVQEPIANLDQTTHFTVTVTNEFGCTDTAGVNIYIKNEVFIPELFTPNNDGNNDYFKVYGLGIKELQLIVYNELGVIVYENNNADEILTRGWNGKHNGNEAKEGKYFWKINGIYYNESKVLFNGKDAGVVTLLR